MNALFIRAMRQAGILKREARIVDFGGGSGLLVRLLRDQGLDAWGYDKFSPMPLCRGFCVKDDIASGKLAADLITSFEVFEHLLQPRETTATLASNLSPGGMILVTTRLYDEKRHDAYWDYLSPEVGQHINFFSASGMNLLAKPMKMKPIFLPSSYHLLVSEDHRLSKFRRVLLLALARGHHAFARAMGLCRFECCERDSRMLAQK